MLWNRAAQIGALLVAAVATGAEPDVSALVQRSNQAVQRDWQALPAYSYLKREAGEHGVKTYRVTMIAGSPYKDLVAIDDHKLSPSEQKAADEARERVKALRASESEAQRQARIAHYQKNRQRDHELLGQLTDAFTFKCLGEETIGNFRSYVLEATPKPGYQPPNVRAQVFTGVRGKMWIDQASGEWIRVEAEVIHPVSIEGFLARVEPGTRFEFERKPVAPGIWFPSHFTVRAHAKILSMFGHSVQTDDTYYGYEKALGG